LRALEAIRASLPDGALAYVILGITPVIPLKWSTLTD
jgi:hypothetical protein